MQNLPNNVVKSARASCDSTHAEICVPTAHPALIEVITVRKTGRAYRRSMNRKKKHDRLDMKDRAMHFWFTEREDKNGDIKGEVLHLSSRKYPTFIKKYCNRQCRREDNDFTGSPGYYRKQHDYLWSIW